jgi:penicillin-binding protein 2
VLLGQYPSEEDMLAVQKGLAAAPIGKPRQAADMTGLLAAAAASAGPVSAAAAQARAARTAALAEAVAKLIPAASAVETNAD